MLPLVVPNVLVVYLFAKIEKQYNLNQFVDHFCKQDTKIKPLLKNEKSLSLNTYHV